MNEMKEQMRPIWYFVGWVLLVIGLIVLAAGIYNLYFDIPHTTILQQLHPNLWWGGVLIVVGGLYLYTNKDARVEQ